MREREGRRYSADDNPVTLRQQVRQIVFAEFNKKELGGSRKVEQLTFWIFKYIIAEESDAGCAQVATIILSVIRNGAKQKGISIPAAASEIKTWMQEEIRRLENR